MARKPNLRLKSGKYWMELSKGKTQKEAARAVGSNSPKDLENTENFKALERSSYREEILKHITMAQIAEEHMKVIKQSEDLGAKNTAIKMAIEKVDPKDEQSSEEKVIVILRD